MYLFIARIFIACSNDPLSQVVKRCRARYIGSHRDKIYLFSERCRPGRLSGSLVSLRISRRAQVLVVRGSLYTEIIERYFVINMLFDERGVYIDYIVRNAEDLRRILSDLYSRGCRVRVSRKFSLSEYFSILTERQISILERALKAGYLDLPKKTSVRDLSRSLKISPPTLSEHMRKGIARIVSEYIVRNRP